MSEWQRVIKEETENCEVTTFPTENGKGTYPYVILPFESRMTPRFLKAVTKGMTRMLKDELKKATTIVLPEAKGFLLSPIAEATGLDLALIRKRNYRVPGQIIIEQRKVYREEEGKKLMYCVGLKKDDVPLLVDDIVSSGGTQISIINALKDNDFDIVGIGTVYERGNGITRVKKETGFDVKSLARFEVVERKPVVIKFYEV